MLDICKYMIYLGAIVYIIVLWHGINIHAGMLTLMTFAVLFIGGGVPAALPVMFTVSQATGAGELAEKGILVTRLDSIENAASVEVLCLDKTGTITKNELEVSEIIPFGKFRNEDVALYAGLASSEGSKDAIDATVLGHAKNVIGDRLKQYKQVSFVPFEPATKRTEAIIELKGKKIKVMKGAPQVLIALCKKTDKKTIAQANKQIDGLSLKGCRALAVAKSIDAKMNEFELVGILALADPIRPDTSAMINDMRNAGIRPMMITGDNIAVAKEIAKQANIGNAIARISELKAMGEERMKEAIEKLNGIAEIYPEDKFSIVKLWQSRGMMVGMTGDGVNDAPALKQAEMGVAVSNSTDVAKAAASIVLTEPGTRLIIDAVKTSRQIYQRMLTWAINKITKSIQFLGITTIGFFWFESIVISITGLMLIVFVNDFLTLALAKDNATSTSNPNKWNVKNLSIASGFLGVLFVLEGVVLMWIGRDYFHLTLEGIQTLILLLFAYTTMFRILIVRERGHCWDSMPSKTVILTTVITVVFFTWISIDGVLLKGLPANMVLFALGFCAVATFLIDIPKYYVFRRLGL
jgi:H+-transporting ATPase